MDIKSDSNFNFICSAPTPWEKGRLFLASGKCKTVCFKYFSFFIESKIQFKANIANAIFLIDIPLSTFYMAQKRQNKPNTQNYVALRKDVINMCRRPEIRTCREQHVPSFTAYYIVKIG